MAPADIHSRHPKVAEARLTPTSVLGLSLDSPASAASLTPDSALLPRRSPRQQAAGSQQMAPQMAPHLAPARTTSGRLPPSGPGKPPALARSGSLVGSGGISQPWWQAGAAGSAYSSGEAALQRRPSLDLPPRPGLSATQQHKQQHKQQQLAAQALKPPTSASGSLFEGAPQIHLPPSGSQESGGLVSNRSVSSGGGSDGILNREGFTPISPAPNGGVIDGAKDFHFGSKPIAVRPQLSSSR